MWNERVKRKRKRIYMKKKWRGKNERKIIIIISVETLRSLILERLDVYYGRGKFSNFIVVVRKKPAIAVFSSNSSMLRSFTILTNTNNTNAAIPETSHLHLFLFLPARFLFFLFVYYGCIHISCDGKPHSSDMWFKCACNTSSSSSSRWTLLM